MPSFLAANCANNTDMCDPTSMNADVRHEQNEIPDFGYFVRRKSLRRNAPTVESTIGKRAEEWTLRFKERPLWCIRWKLVQNLAHASLTFDCPVDVDGVFGADVHDERVHTVSSNRN